MTDPTFLKHAALPYARSRVPGVRRTYCRIEERLAAMPGADPRQIIYARARQWGTVTCPDCIDAKRSLTPDELYAE